MRINPYALKRPTTAPETRTFTDPANPDTFLDLTLAPKGGFNDALLVGEAANKLVSDYVTGVIAPPETEGAAPVVKVPPTPLMIPNFGIFKPSESLCFHIARLMHCQVPAEGEPPYDFAEWCLLSEVLPTAFPAITRWAENLTEAAKGAAKNEPGASTEA